MQDLPIVGPILFGHTALVYASWVLTAARRLLPRAHPARAQRAGGRRVARRGGRHGDQRRRLPLRHTIAGGALAGVAGACFSLDITPQWSDGLVFGHGLDRDRAGRSSPSGAPTCAWSGPTSSAPSPGSRSRSRPGGDRRPRAVPGAALRDDHRRCSCWSPRAGPSGGSGRPARSVCPMFARSADGDRTPAHGSRRGPPDARGPARGAAHPGRHGPHGRAQLRPPPPGPDARPQPGARARGLDARGRRPAPGRRGHLRPHRRRARRAGPRAGDRLAHRRLAPDPQPGDGGRQPGTASPAGDALPPLVAAGADVGLASVRGTRRVPVADFCTGPKRSVLAPDELITDVRLPVAARAAAVRQGGAAQRHGHRGVLASRWPSTPRPGRWARASAPAPPR